MEPLRPTQLQGHTFQKLEPAGKKINWQEMTHAAMVSALANDILKKLKEVQNVMKQGQQ